MPSFGELLETLKPLLPGILAATGGSLKLPIGMGPVPCPMPQDFYDQEEEDYMGEQGQEIDDEAEVCIRGPPEFILALLGKVENPMNKQ